MATAAAAVGQRMQFQAVLGQGQVEIGHEGVGLPGTGEPLGLSEGYDRLSTYARSEPPPVPQHLQASMGPGPHREGVFAGLARAGQALRRRVVEPVLQHVARSPAPHPSPSLSSGYDGPRAGSVRPSEGVFPPGVSEAMQEWTSRASLIAPGPQGQVVGRDESSASSLSPELIMEEVKRQVQIAMAEKNSEMRDLQKQNDLLKKALQDTLSGRIEDRDPRELAGRPPEGSGDEPGPSSAVREPEGQIFMEILLFYLNVPVYQGVIL